MHAYARDQRSDDRSNAKQLAHRGARADATFKPVALPALAAAMVACRTSARAAEHRDATDLPAILREDAQLG